MDSKPTGFNRNASATLKIAVFAPMPRPSVSATMMLNTGFLARTRTA